MRECLVTLVMLLVATCVVAQNNNANQLLSRMEEAIGKIKTISYSSRTHVINSGKADSSENYIARCWLKRVQSDTIFGAYLHMEQKNERGRSDYYYDGINGIDIWHEARNADLVKTITVVTPKDLPNGINDVQTRESLIPFCYPLIDTTVRKWKQYADSIRVNEREASWVLEWNVNRPRAGAYTLFRLVIDKKSELLSEWHQFTTFNGVRYFTSQFIHNVKVNDVADEDNVQLKTTYPGYSTLYFRDESKQKQGVAVASMLSTRSPSFSYPAFSGKTVRSGRQKLLLLDFWETWCGYCIVAMPEMKALHERFSGRGLEIVGVVTENREQVGKILKSQKTPYETIFADKLMLQKFRVVARPRYVLVDETGTIIAVSEGALDEIEKIILEKLGT